MARIKIFLVAFLCLAAAACNKQLDVDSSRQAKEEGHWTRYEDARSGLIGLYGLFRAAVADNNAHWMWGELRQGDFQAVFRPDLKAIIEGNLNASYPLLQEVSNWRRFYAVINACNLFIERVHGALQDKRYTESYYKLDIAQARTIRAFAYFYMVRIWGDVPLITRSYDGEFAALPRTKKETVLSFAEQELIEAAQRLPYLYSGNDPEQQFPSNYYGTGQDTWLNTPFTKLAAYAILSHVCAWQGRYLDVATYTEFILNNYTKSNLGFVTVDQLVSPSGFFQAGNQNYNQLVSFNFIYNRGESTSDGHLEQLTLANTTNYAMSKQLPDIYVPKDSISRIFPGGQGNDQRFGIDNRYTPALLLTSYFENYNAEVPVFKKIRVVNGNVSGNLVVYNSSIVFTRMEEIRLLRAEALAVVGATGEALVALNSVRTSRGLEPVSLSPSVDLLTEIFAERRRELMGEGWRWYDQVRYNRLKHNNPAFNKLLDGDGIYWPIAGEVLTRNPQLQQNSYWR